MRRGNPHPKTAHLNRGGPGRPKGSKDRLSRERVEQELRFLALSDPILLFDTKYKGRRKFTLKEIDAMPEEIRRCIASVKVRTENLTAGDDAQDTTVEVKLWDKVKALELCGRVLGIFVDKVQITTDETVLAALDRIKERNRAKGSG